MRENSFRDFDIKSLENISNKEFYNKWFADEFGRKPYTVYIHNIINKIDEFIEDSNKLNCIDYIGMRIILNRSFKCMSETTLKDYDYKKLIKYIDFIDYNIYEEKDNYLFLKKYLTPSKFEEPIEFHQILSLLNSKRYKHFKVVVPYNYCDNYSYLTAANFFKLFKVDEKRGLLILRGTDYPADEYIVDDFNFDEED